MSAVLATSAQVQGGGLELTVSMAADCVENAGKERSHRWVWWR